MTGKNKQKPLKLIALGLLGLAIWFGIYKQLLPFSHYLAYAVLGLEQGSHLGEAIQFFVYDTPKVMMLLTLIVFVVGMIRSFFTPEKTRKVLAGKRESTGNVMAAGLGIVTPFCSCSAVPLFIGFVQAGVPLGVTFSFLIAAPMVNEVAVVLLYGLLGWKVAAIYLGTGLTIAIVAGWVIGRLNMESGIEDWVLEIRAGEQAEVSDHLSWGDRIEHGKEAVRDIVTKVWPYVIAGIGVGAASTVMSLKILWQESWARKRGGLCLPLWWLVFLCIPMQQGSYQWWRRCSVKVLLLEQCLPL